MSQPPSNGPEGDGLPEGEPGSGAQASDPIGPSSGPVHPPIGPPSTTPYGTYPPADPYGEGPRVPYDPRAGASGATPPMYPGYSGVPDPHAAPPVPLYPTWVGVAIGAGIVVLASLFVGTVGGWNSGVLFGGVTVSIPLVLIAAIILVIPVKTRKIGQGLFLVLGALPLIWFGTCVAALAGV